MPTMGQGATENGGLGGTYETTQSTTVQPNAIPAANTQAGTQAQITADYSKLIQQALAMYNTSNQVQTQAAQEAVYAPTTVNYTTNSPLRDWRNFSGNVNTQSGNLVYGSPEYNELMRIGNQTGIYTVTGTNPGEMLTPAQAAQYEDVDSPYGRALQGSLDSLGQMSNADAYNALLIGAGANNGTDLIDRSTFQPYMDAGTNAANEWQALAGLGPNPLNAQQIQDRYLNTAGVRAQMRQGNQALNANYGAKGLTGSSAIMKALTEFGQGIASQNIGAAQQQLYQMAGLGAQASNAYASQLNQNYATNVDAQLKNQQLSQNAANSRGQLANAALINQTSLLNSLGGGTSSLATQAAIERMKTIAGSQQDTNSVKISAPILETMSQTLGGIGANAGGSALGAAMLMALL